MVEVIELTDPSADAHIARHFGRTPILVQLPTVFAIVAPPTHQGAQLLDRCKNRLPGKFYSVLIGDLQRFLHLSSGTPLSDYLLQSGGPDRVRTFKNDLCSTFIRTPVASKTCSSKMICNGTLQGLILGGILERKMRWMEELSASLPDKILDTEQGHYCAPIASSCNMSGDPAGSITDFDRALAFAKSRGVELVLTNRAARDGGSNPIFGIQNDRVETFRDGPGVSKKRHLLEDWLGRALADPTRFGSLAVGMKLSPSVGVPAA